VLVVEDTFCTIPIVGNGKGVFCSHQNLIAVKLLKCWNLECIIDAEQHGKDAPSKLKLEDHLNEEAGREGDNAKDAEEVIFIN
jgi:hypothetical protein